MTASRLDTHYMAFALRLAARARGAASPNPMVGAVVVSGSRIVGKGFHRRPGTAHAELLALRQAGAKSKGATLYVTLEPCSHRKKRTPPCVPAVLAAGLRRVVIAMPDPNPRVRGRGIRRLRRAGLRVDVGCLQPLAESLNQHYGHWVRTGLPFVVLKSAMTLDGKIATAKGESRWITGEVARRHLHRQRRNFDAILVGVGTVLRDDPHLTVRLGKGQPGGRQPLRVILDSRLRTPLTAAIVRQAPDKTLIVTLRSAPRNRMKRLRALGASVASLPGRPGHVSFTDCLRFLGRAGITGVLIEGGGEVNASALASGLVNRVLLYVAPKLLGGQDAKGAIGGLAPRRLADAWELEEWRTRRLGPDLLIEATLKRRRPPRRRR